MGYPVTYYCPRCGTLVELEREGYLSDKAVTPYPFEGWTYADPDEPFENGAADGVRLLCGESDAPGLSWKRGRADPWGDAVERNSATGRESRSPGDGEASGDASGSRTPKASGDSEGPRPSDSRDAKRPGDSAERSSASSRNPRGSDDSESAPTGAGSDGDLGCGEAFYLSFVRHEGGEEVDPRRPSERVELGSGRAPRGPTGPGSRSRFDPDGR